MGLSALPALRLGLRPDNTRCITQPLRLLADRGVPFPERLRPRNDMFSVPNSGERAQDSPVSPALVLFKAQVLTAQPAKPLAEGLDVPDGDFRVGRPELLTGRPWLDGPLHTRANLMALLYVTGVR